MNVIEPSIGCADTSIYEYNKHLETLKSIKYQNYTIAWHIISGCFRQNLHAVFRLNTIPNGVFICNGWLVASCHHFRFFLNHVDAIGV